MMATHSSTNCAFATASTNSLSARMDSLEQNMADVQSTISTMAATIKTNSDHNSNQDAAIASVTKMQGPKVTVGETHNLCFGFTNVVCVRETRVLPVRKVTRVVKVQDQTAAQCITVKV
jgi:hypothetical protein